MVELWQLASLAHEVRILCKENVLINVSGVGDGAVLLHYDAFVRLFPFGGWEETPTPDGNGVIYSFKYDSIIFKCVRYD